MAQREKGERERTGMERERRSRGKLREVKEQGKWEREIGMKRYLHTYMYMHS